MHGTIGRLQVMDTKGHTEIAWDSDKPIDVKIAKQAFEIAIREGYNAFRVEGEDRGERIREFDPKAEKIMMVPQLVGG